MEGTSEGKHLCCIIDVGATCILAPFLVPIIEFSVAHMEGMDLSNGLELGLWWYKLCLEVLFELGPCPV